MTNIEIVMGNTVMLIADGVINENEEIHTYAHWKSLGFQVKKGEHAVAKFPIWKYTNGKKKDMSEEEAQAKGYCFMKNSSWFSSRQVEPIDKENSTNTWKPNDKAERYAMLREQEEETELYE